MAAPVRLAVDCMGGDRGPSVAVSASLLALRQYPDLHLTLVGDQDALRRYLHQNIPDRISLLHSDEQVEMGDMPGHALRHKTGSSMRMAIDLIAEGRVAGVVSAGNTGALMAMGYYVLKTLPGIDRPAICSVMPSASGHSYLLDLGANVDSSAVALHQFAIMGSALCTVLSQRPQPRVALLNLAREDGKGSGQVKQAADAISADARLNYCGFIEADNLLQDQADVIVCDGFVGNVALKATEGTAVHIAGLLKAQFQQFVLGRLAGCLVKPLLRPLYRRLDPQYYNGASFLGLNGVLVKSHGDSNAQGFANAIGKARLEIKRNLLAGIRQHLADVQ